MVKISTRLVILLPKVVLKFPLSRRGYLQSKNEKLIWNKYKKKYPLGKLYWELFGVVCMKKYRSVNDIPKLTVIDLKSIIEEFDIERCDLYNSANWGQENKVYFLIDYGINQFISTLYKDK